MLIVLLFIISIVGTMLITREEIKRDKATLSSSRSLWMGKWPYNLVLLIGVAALILATYSSFKNLITIVTFFLTVAFYGYRLYRERI